MIERFQEIKRIGTFKDPLQIASCGFNKHTIIFGGNSQGKSTLCDIIKSLSSGNASYIEERKTVGELATPYVKISFGNKKDAVYSNNKWTISKNLPEAQHILVFDSEFVQRNVFTNSTIERQNKEYFTEFILGSDSNEIQKALVELKDQKNYLDAKNSQIVSQIEKASGLGMSRIIEATYQDDVSLEDTNCLGLHQQLYNLNSDKKNIESIKNLPLPKLIDYTDTIIKQYSIINTILESFFEFSSESIVDKFKQHKEKFKIDNASFDEWLSVGTKIASDICPYCGRSIKNNDLVESYIVLFCNEFKEYCTKVDDLRKIQFPADSLSLLSKQLSENRKLMSNLSPKIYTNSFADSVKYWEEKAELIELQLNDIEVKIDILNAEYKKAITTKLDNKYNTVNAVDLQEIQTSVNLFDKIIIDYNTALSTVLKSATEYLEKLSPSTIESTIAQFQSELDRLNAIVFRNKYNDQIEEYKKNVCDIAKISEKSKSLKNEFDNSQTAFLTTFFADINKFYNRLGSKNYRIEKDTNGQGTKKVYTVKLFFREKEVESSRIKFVLSDSDKRALALAIFFSKLKNEPNLNNAIIVLDDPINSFDIERMTLFINTLKEFENANQIIILTHYADFYKRYVELNYELNPAPSLIKIQYLPDGNRLLPINKNNEPLLMEDYERALYELYSFISGATHSYSSNDARTILHKYLEYCFYYEIREKNISHRKLEVFLSELHNYGLIDDSLYTRLNAKRTEYNVNSHIFDNDSEDTKRNSIIELKEILCSI